MIDEALRVAEDSDVIVAVVGEAREMTGEAASRTDIGVPENQRALLRALKETGKNLVVVVLGGRPMTLLPEFEMADALVMGWFGGTETGRGLADLLTGAANFSGKLTTSFPLKEAQIPVYYAHRRTGRPSEVPPGQFQKFRSLYMDCPNEPLFPFGYGLSYSQFEYGPVRVNKSELSGDGDKLIASVTITNRSARAGSETVQLYIGDPVANLTRPVKELKGFQKVALAPGEQQTVSFEITPEQLAYTTARTIADYRRDWEPGRFRIEIGPNSRDTQKISVHWARPSSTHATPKEIAPAP